MLRVLITYGWCRTAYAVAESLSRANFRVWACGPSQLSMTRYSRFVRGFDLAPDPFSSPEEYVNQLAKIVARRRIDLLLPVHEDALVIQTYRNRLPSTLIVASPPREDLAKVLDKMEIIQVADSAGVDFPRTIVPTSLAEAEEYARRANFPLLIKTRRGNSGKGVFPVGSPEEASRILAEVISRFNLSDDHMPLLQERIEGGLYGSCFLAKQGDLLACFTEHYLRCKGNGFGTSVVREPCDWSLLIGHTRRMVRALNWTGLGHFDFIADAQRSRAFLIEMNPRFWGALRMAICNGYDFPRALLTMLIDGTPHPESFSPVTKPIKGVWVAGEMIAVASELRRGDLLAPFKSLARFILASGSTRYDDFRLSDPLPLFAELAYYASQFITSGGDTNPVSTGMIS